MKQKLAYKRRKHLFISLFNQKQYMTLNYIRLESDIRMHVSNEKIKKYFKYNVC